MRRLVVILFVVVAVVGMAAGVAGARSEPASTTSYTKVVDGAMQDRFEADESWGKSSYGQGVYGDNYRYARPAEDGTAARYKVDIPETAKYAIYARWPDVKGLNGSVAVGVETTSGLEWSNLDQSQDGGRWVRVGVFEMEKGDDYYVRISPETEGEGYVAADAMKVVQVSSNNTRSEETSGSTTSEKSKSDASRGRSGEEASSRQRTESDSSRGDAASSGEAVVREARKSIGTRYRLGGTSRSGMDCSGLTMVVFRQFGVKLPHWDDKQYRYGAPVSGSLRPGDVVFFDEHGQGISHVGIYSGNGKLIHASDYYNKVVESEMKYIKGYKGARRMV